ncbi:hypothetical protein WQ57_05635 [Mesobacillus campisalis]|uniref:Uncharacterized protein n=1 Tax=Mesobacillus campisalis TaxID=1408103 RepID=A0A0M2T201_9BACI|nr:hypothetical protein [Mesobacillus campisalis]KKK38835.1 hypothetical protein WQ57_05635 [Mesobacillus campisalis]
MKKDMIKFVVGVDSFVVNEFDYLVKRWNFVVNELNFVVRRWGFVIKPGVFAVKVEGDFNPIHPTVQYFPPYVSM